MEPYPAAGMAAGLAAARPETEPSMADAPAGDDDRLALDPEAFLASLQPEEEMLLRIRDELYEGSWETMRRDLQNRLAGKPYIFKLVSRIEHDLQAVALLARYEREHDVDLGARLE
jgi:hypothetical protein